MLDDSGEFVQEVYFNGALKFAKTGTFQIRKMTQMFQIRVFDPPAMERDTGRRILVTSDYTDVYESQIFETQHDREKSVGAEWTARSIAWGEFRGGIMPNSFQAGGVVQLLTLAVLLCGDRASLVGDDELRETVIPEYMKAVSKAESTLLRTQIVRRNEGNNASFTVLFWGEAERTTSGAKSISQNRFLIGKLDVEAISEGLPTRITFVHNRRFPNRDTGLMELQLASRYIYTATVQDSPLVDLLHQTAFSNVDKVSVNDYRFSKTIPLGYLFSTGDKLTFRTDPSYQGLEVKAQARQRLTNVMDGRTKVIGVLCILSLLPLALILRSGLIVNKKHPELI